MIVIYYSLQNAIEIIIVAEIIYKLLLKFCIMCCFLKIRVNRKYPNYRVSEIAGSVFSGLILGNNFYYLNFKLPKLPDPKKSGNPNA